MSESSKKCVTTYFPKSKAPKIDAANRPTDFALFFVFMERICRVTFWSDGRRACECRLTGQKCRSQF